MIAAIKKQSQNHIHCHGSTRQGNHHRRQSPSHHRRKCLGNDFGPQESREQFERKHVVIVMDALKEFSVETLAWVLKNIALDTCCKITLLGVKPWLTFALSCKTETDIWSMNTNDLPNMRDSDEWKKNIRCQKAQEVVDLCLKYGVTPQIKSEQGFPLRLLILESIASSYATWVVFDRHHNKKHIEYVAKKVPCNILVMNSNGEADMIKGHSTTFECNDESPVTSSTSTKPTLKLMLSDEVKKKLKIISH